MWRNPTQPKAAADSEDRHDHSHAHPPCGGRLRPRGARRRRPASAASVKLSGGSTTLKLDAGTAKALKSLGVAATPIEPAKAGSKGISFPITGGTIDPATAAGTITHSGGLQLRAGSTRVRLTSFTIGVDKTPSLSVKAGKARLTAFSLSLAKAKVARAGLGTTVSASPSGSARRAPPP